MEFLLTLWNSVIPFLVVLTVLVFVHEMGHYLVARYCGVKIEVFSIGFGREIIGWNDKVGTRWKFSLIPIGGYVKMLGEVPDGTSAEAGQSGIPTQSDEDSFNSKSLGQRAAVVFAGPFANFLFAVVLLTGMFIFIGQPHTPADISKVVPNSAAERAGIKPGDIIKSINGTEIERFEQVVRIVQFAPGGDLSIIVERDGRQLSLFAVADVHELTDRYGKIREIGRLGVSRSSADSKMVKYSPLTAAWRAVGETAAITGNILETLWQIIVGERSSEELGGPIRIAQISGEMWQVGLSSLLMFSVMLSINLGLINLFPIPMLDGGHLLFYVIEAIRGKPLGERAQEYGFRIGIAMVLALMVFATWNDLIQMNVFDYLVELVT